MHKQISIDKLDMQSCHNDMREMTRVFIRVKHVSFSWTILHVLSNL